MLRLVQAASMAVVIALSVPFAWRSNALRVLPGDANCDERIDEDDLTALVRHIFAEEPSCPDADVNGDGGVTAADLPLLLDLVVAARTLTPSPAATHTPDPNLPTPTPSTTSNGTPTPPATLPPSPTGTRTHTGLPNTPPPLDSTVATTVGRATAFLYTGANPIQTGVAPGTIEERRAAAIRGKVLTRDGQPLPGVTVTVLGHPEYGQTETRSTGMFDLVVNGGGYLTVNYVKAGYLPAQRQVHALWQDWVVVPDVTLIPLDPMVTPVDLTHPGMQVARGRVVTDERGSRQSTLVFPEGTQAQLVFEDGSTQPLSALSVRVTEYSVGADGAGAMPAELPPGIGYTYAAELTVDEAVAAGAPEIRFSQPVVNYVEDFIGFGAGAVIPTYYYDRGRGLWVPFAAGQAIRLVGVSGGLAELDTDGDGVADDAAALAALGITEAEQQRLATLYAVGVTLWRVRLEHFSTVDYNMPYEYPPSYYPAAPEVRAEEPEPLQCEQPAQSTVGCQDQVLGESIRVGGTPFTLNYRSDRVPGRVGAYRLEVPVPARACSFAVVSVQVAGRRLEETLPCSSEPQVYELVWDGLDAYGRAVQAPVPVAVAVAYAYPARRCAWIWDPQTQEWYKSCRVVPGFDVLWSDQWTSSLGLWNAQGLGFGGWTLNVHHAYSPLAQSLLLGDGRVRRATAGDRVLTKEVDYYSGLRRFDVGPDGSIYFADRDNSGVLVSRAPGHKEWIAGTYHVYGYSGDGGLATAATLSAPTDVTVGMDRSLYIADSGNHVIRRIDPDGIIDTFAGTGVRGTTGDGGAARQARLDSPQEVAVTLDGSVYIRGSRYVRKVTPDGIINTIFTAPVLASPCGPIKTGLTGMAVASDGVLFVSTGSNCSSPYEGSRSIYRIDLDGTQTIVAGNGKWGFAGDGGPATEARFSGPEGLAIARDGSLYVADRSFGGVSSNRVRKVSPQGIITSVMGCGNYVATVCDNNHKQYGEPGGKTLLYPYDLAMGPDDSLYVRSPGGIYGQVILASASPLPGIAVGDIVVPSDRGDEAYVFSASGQHLRTVHSLTGATLYQFGYDAASLLVSITDGNGNVTTIERDGAGNPTAIVSPYGQRTPLALDAEGFLAAITNPAGEAWQFAYGAGGLLSVGTNPRGFASGYTYDGHGRLVHAQDAAGGSQTLVRTLLPRGQEVTRTTAMGRTTTYRGETLPTGERQLTNTFPGGVQTQALTGNDGKTVVTAPNGMIYTTQTAADARFGMQVPFGVSLISTTPGGLTSTISRERSVSLDDPADPLSLRSQTTTTTVNGRMYTEAFETATGSVRLTTPMGREVLTTLDALGRVTAAQAANLEPFAFTYDAAGRLAAMTQGTGPASRQYGFTYGADGLLAGMTDPLGRVLSLSRDAAGRTTRALRADGTEVAFGYDARGNLTALTPPGRPVHQLGYTAVDQIGDYTPPDVGAGTNRTQYAYNVDRDLTQMARPDGVTVALGYSGAGQVATVSLARGTVSYLYDAVSGQLTAVTAPDGGQVGFTYDGMLRTQTTWTGTVAGTVEQTHDTDFRVASQSVNGGHLITLAYDDDGLLTGAGDLSLSRNSQHGLVVGTTLGNVTDARGHSGFGELASYEARYGGTSIFATQYARDNLGRIVTLTETVGGLTSVYQYDYDVLGRLTAVEKGGVSISTYQYDDNGNRLAHNGVTGSYDHQDRLLQYGAATFSYTANGELQSKTVGAATTQYVYDALGNLMSVTLPGGSVIEYVVDGLNRRIGKKVDGTLVQGFLYQDQLNPVAELDGSGNVVARFVYASKGNVPDYVVKGGATYRIISDHLGSLRLLVDTATGSVAQQIDYDEFGNIISDTNPGVQPFGFAGGIYDPGTQLTRFGVRDYDAASGRWTSKDPARFRGGDSNLYAYALNDPVDLVDPGGRVVPAVAIVIVATLANPAVQGLLVDAADFVINFLGELGVDACQGVSLAQGYPLASGAGSVYGQVAGRGAVAASNYAQAEYREWEEWREQQNRSFGQTSYEDPSTAMCSGPIASYRDERYTLYDERSRCPGN